MGQLLQTPKPRGKAAQQRYVDLKEGQGSHGGTTESYVSQNDSGSPGTLDTSTHLDARS